MKKTKPAAHIRGAEEYDRSGMLGIIKSFQEQCRDAKRIGYEFRLPQGFGTKFSNIVCAGLGGSAIGADLVGSYLSGELEIPLSVSRDYKLPGFACDRTLAVISSYSGDTEETLSSYHDAKARGCSIVAITSGGKLSKLAAEDGLPVINIPGALPPRTALGYSFFTTLILLSKAGLVKDKAPSIDEAINGLKKPRKEEAAKIASRLYGKLPVIYGSEGHLRAVVTRWRGQIAENSKTLASSHLFPEMSHNEIVGWQEPRGVLKDTAVIMLRDRDDHSRVSKRMDVVKRMLAKKKIDVIEARSSGKGLLDRMFSLLYMADYVSFYLAVMNKVDPTPVDSIVQLKRKLSR